ncbi:DNA recombination protein RmuC [Patescibacteria group bacterium]|nr:DNA recombination protein RmuC [Patescibacteria group bacterium]
MTLYLLLGLFAGLSLALGLYFFVIKKNSPKADKLADDFFAKFNEHFPQILNQANQSLVNMADQKLSAQSRQNADDLAHKKDSIDATVKQVLQELKNSSNKLEEAEQKRIGSFESLKTELKSHQKITADLSATTEALKKVLSNNQLRGAFGEKVAEDLLQMAGFVKGVNYEFNKKQNSASTRPDFAILLPDGVRINVDAKFPYQNLQKMAESKNKQVKSQCLKAFKQDVSAKVKQVTGRDYINPEEKTVDFVIVFIPNEMIFSFIYDKLSDIWQDAMGKKVIFAGPFSFTAILRMVLQAYDNFRYQENVQSIIGHIRQFEQEFDKYNLEFAKIGDRLDSLNRQYNQVGQTRTNKLLRVVDKIKIEAPQAKKALPHDI